VNKDCASIKGLENCHILSIKRDSVRIEHMTKVRSHERKRGRKEGKKKRRRKGREGGREFNLLSLYTRENLLLHCN
jgi:hypothetical protein